MHKLIYLHFIKSVKLRMITTLKNKINSHMRFLLLVFILLIKISPSSAQFNTEIGYTLSYMPAKSINSVIDAYNDRQDMIKEMKSFAYIGGFNAGVTFRTGGLKYGLFWESQTTRKTGTEGLINSSEAAKEEKLYFYFNSVSGGLALTGDNLGLGTTVDYNFFRLKTTKSGVSSKVDVIRKDYLSSKIYGIVYLRINQKLGIEFKPYCRLPWTDVELTPLTEYLDVDQKDETRYSHFIQYGLSFNILNGKQRE